MATVTPPTGEATRAWTARSTTSCSPDALRATAPDADPDAGSGHCAGPAGRVWVEGDAAVLRRAAVGECVARPELHAGPDERGAHPGPVREPCPEQVLRAE